MSDRAWVATRKGLFELRRSQGDWRIAGVSFLGDPVSMVLPSQPGESRMLAALNLGHWGVKVHASADAGASWTEVAAPVYPPQPEGAPGPAWTLAQIWSLEQANGSVWAGTLPGGLFRSRDYGASWQLVDALWSRSERLEWFGGGYDVPGIHSICPHPSRPQELLVGISCGGAWLSQDDGAAWRLAASGMRAGFMPPEQADNPNIQDPHRIVRCHSAPDTLWCQHHGGIWRSNDNAASWQAIEGAPLSSFGFALAVHPGDPATAWFVPAQADEKRIPVGGALVVNCTRDGGRSFETLSAGLPAQHAYDLVYRHGLAIDAGGEQLLMGSTTGGLWATRDGGAQWRAVSAHLPPIYAVRFG